MKKMLNPSKKRYKFLYIHTYTMSLYIWYSVQPRHQHKWQWHMQDFFARDLIWDCLAGTPPFSLKQLLLFIFLLPGWQGKREAWENDLTKQRWTCTHITLISPVTATDFLRSATTLGNHELPGSLQQAVFAASPSAFSSRRDGWETGPNYRSLLSKKFNPYFA